MRDPEISMKKTIMSEGEKQHRPQVKHQLLCFATYQSMDDRVVLRHGPFVVEVWRTSETNLTL